MAIEEKDNRQNIKLTVDQVMRGIHWQDRDDIMDAIYAAAKLCKEENKAQEILIVIDRGF